MSVAIKVENLSKKYIIRHEKKSARYETFSESLIQGSKNIGSRIRHPFTASNNDQQTQEEFWALKDINFEINQGDKVGIIGRNGAGKSTLLKILSRITEPTTGKIHINGRIASLLEVGTGFHPELTGRENIYLNGAILGMSRKEIKARFDEIVDFAEVEKFLDTPVKRYSSGMYVRLAFAVAAHLEPEILVVDEVLAVGDMQFQRKCLGKMDEVGREGRTVLLVSHNMSAIRRVCEHVVLIDTGRIGGIFPNEEGVKKYFKSNSSKEIIKASFPNNKSKSICIRGIEFGKELVDGAFEYKESIPIHIQYQVNKVISNARFGCIIHNQDGVVLATCDTDMNPGGYAKRTIGLYSTVFELPAKLLNEGGYYVSVTTGIPTKEVLDFKEQVVSFSIADRTTRLKLNSNESRAGVCFIEIPWNVTKIDG